VALGTREVWWHLLRHTCATSLLCGWWGRRWSLDEVSKLLGHSSVKVTERYAHLLDSALAGIAAESHVWWLARRSSGGSDGSSGGGSAPPSGAPTPSSGTSSPGAAASASEGEDLSMAVSRAESAFAEILNDSTSAPQRIRTSDLRLRRPSLYPAELVAQGTAPHPHTIPPPPHATLSTRPGRRTEIRDR